MCICRIIFLTEASNNHNDSFPFFLSLFSFCALHRFRRGKGRWRKASVSDCLPAHSDPLWVRPCFGCVVCVCVCGGGGGGAGAGGGGFSPPLKSPKLQVPYAQHDCNNTARPAPDGASQTATHRHNKEGQYPQHQSPHRQHRIAYTCARNGWIRRFRKSLCSGGERWSLWHQNFAGGKFRRFS